MSDIKNPTPKKTAVFLFDLFSNYELSVALSILGQSGRKYDVFGLKKEAVSEEGLRVVCGKLLEDVVPGEYDSLLIPGCLDLSELINDERVYGFLKKFDSPDTLIAAISSAPLLLLKAGMLEGKRFLAGVIKEELYEEGFTPEQMKNMIDAAEYGKAYSEIGPYIADGNVLTTLGGCFIEFGIKFGEMLSLDFEPGWYRSKIS